MNFSEVSKLPYKHLPTEVLLSIRDHLRKELTRRGCTSEYEKVLLVPKGGGIFRSGKVKPEEKHLKKRLFELDALMDENWSHLFPGESLDGPKSYPTCRRSVPVTKIARRKNRPWAAEERA